MKISKNNYSPNDRFLIKILIKIISLDSSQRVPPMSPCPPLIITTVCPWLINHLSDPWDFNKSNGILLRSNWRKPYPKFYGSELLIIKGWSRKLARRSDWPTGGGLINPMLPLYDICVYVCMCVWLCVNMRSYTKSPTWHWTISHLDPFIYNRSMMFPMKMLIYSGDFPASSQAALDAAAFRAEFRATLEAGDSISACGHGCELMDFDQQYWWFMVI